MIESLGRPIPAHRGHGQGDEDGPEQDRTENDHQERGGQPAT
jgi:hypothetical protein